MGIGMNFTKNGLIALISIVFVVGIGTAYAGMALPTITLAGNVGVDGDLDVDNDVNVGNTLEVDGVTTLHSELKVGTDDPSNNDRISFDDDSKYLEWNNSQLELELINADFDIEQDLSIGRDDVDADIIGFSGNTESLMWDETVIEGSGWFEFSDALAVQGHLFGLDSGSFTGDFRVDSPTFFVDSTGERVGIGTTNPLKKLHVAGDILLDANGDIVFENNDIRIRQSGNDLELESGDDIDLYPEGVFTVDFPTLVVSSSADRVGIGTSSPQAKLHVDGGCIGCMQFYTLTHSSPIAGTNDLDCLNGDPVISGGGWAPGTTTWLRESQPLDSDTWRLSFTDKDGNHVAPGQFKIICADMNPND